MNLIQRDLAHFWHPCAQMKDFEKFPPLAITHAEGNYIMLQNGNRLIDAISSWWCKSLGHKHPKLKQALINQWELFDHVITTTTTNETLVALSEKLASFNPALSRVMYASDGASAVEIALKMSLHAQQLQGQPHRNQFLALKQAYHGETVFTLGVSDLSLYRTPFESHFQSATFIQNMPYVCGPQDPLWQNCSTHWELIEKEINPIADRLSAIIVEPVVQGAAGMRIYSPDLLKRLHRFSREHGIHFIADEIMTGVGRTGKRLACEHAAITPDFVCLSKGLTAGVLPLSATLITDAIYNLFYDDYEKGKSFLHSHTQSGNALAASVALAALNILETENIYENVSQHQSYLFEKMQSVANETGLLTDVRNLGWIVAADIQSNIPRAGYTVYQNAVKLGALIRPIGNTVYWAPPLNCGLEIINDLQAITTRALLAANLQ